MDKPASLFCAKPVVRGLVAALALYSGAAIATPGDSSLPVKESDSIVGWGHNINTPGNARIVTDLESPHGGIGCGKIEGTADGTKARATFLQNFGKQNMPQAGKKYRASFSYIMNMPFAGDGSIRVDYFTEGSKENHVLLEKKLNPSAEWAFFSEEFTFPENVTRMRYILAMQGRGTIRFDDAFLGEAREGVPNLLKNPGFEPSSALPFETAADRNTGKIKFAGDFENGTNFKVKEINPGEFYIYDIHANNDQKIESFFMWFHFRVDGCKDRELTFHLNPGPRFQRDFTAGNGTRSPVMSYDQDHWTGIENKSWSDDGIVLTFKQKFTQPTAWIASFYPITPAHILRFIDINKNSKFFKAGEIGKSRLGRPMRLYTITDPSVNESQKKAVLFTTLHHDLETTGAMTQEGLCRFLLSSDPKADKLRRAFVFYVVPMMDPDGVAMGNTYRPGGDAGNLNRQWGIGTAPETTCVEKFVKALAARDRKVELFIDFHGWCNPERSMQFLTFGKEITDPETEAEELRLLDCVKPHLNGKAGHVYPVIVRKMVDFITFAETDLRRKSDGWMKFEAGARLSYCIEPFADGAVKQEECLQWGEAIGKGIADFYGL